MQYLPRDVVHMIIGMMNDPVAIALLGKTCRAMRKAVMREEVWEQQCCIREIQYRRNNSWIATFAEQEGFRLQKNSVSRYAGNVGKLACWMNQLLGRPLPPQREYLVSGLFAAGVSSTLWKLANHYRLLVECSMPTIGFSLETLEIKARKQPLRISSWSEGGSDRIRSMYEPYFAQTQGLIWIVDGSNDDGIEIAENQTTDECQINWMDHRLPRAKRDLHRMLREIGRQIPLVILVADLSKPQNVISCNRIAHVLSLPDLKQPWHTEPHPAADLLTGIMTALDWLEFVQ